MSVIKIVCCISFIYQSYINLFILIMFKIFLLLFYPNLLLNNNNFKVIYTNISINIINFIIYFNNIQL